MSGCPINMCGCHQDLSLLLIGSMVYNPHARFYYSKLLTYLSYDYGSFSNISDIDLCGSGVRKYLIDVSVRNILDIKIT